MKKIRIGVGSGGCAVERMEPALDLIERGNIDYLIFECLSERTVAEAQQRRLSDPRKGYNEMLQIRMKKMLKRAKEKNIKIVSNMGGANTAEAVKEIVRIAYEQELDGVKIAMVSGDDIVNKIHMYDDLPLWNSEGTVGSLENIISANIYLGADGIKEALDMGADVVITGRVADPSLFVGPIQHEFNIENTQQLGQAILLGHLLECCAQITGGYYVDPGMKNLENLEKIGFPIAEIDESGIFTITKLPGTGGAVNIDICKEQLLYEITDPRAYITPDGVADFGNVRFEQIEEDVVRVSGAMAKQKPETYKVNIGYTDCYQGVAEISYGGLNSLNRARLVADVIQKRWDIIGVTPLESRIEYIGYNSLYGDKIAAEMSDGKCPEVRLRVSVRTKTEEEAIALNHETQCLYINGAAGGAGISATVRRVISVESVIIPRDGNEYHVGMEEVTI